MDYAAVFAEGYDYQAFLSKYGTAEHQARWERVHAAVRLSDAQRELLGSFKRKMHVLCLAGAWCGDCVDQCPIFDHFAAASPNILLKFVDRDAREDLKKAMSICGGARVPAVLLLSEDFAPCGFCGDRTLAKYRLIAKTQLGPACPTGIAPPSEELLTAVTAEWLEQFERVQIMLRTSPRLRTLHND